MKSPEVIGRTPKQEVVWKQSCLVAIPNALRLGVLKMLQHELPTMKSSEKQISAQAGRSILQNKMSRLR